MRPDARTMQQIDKVMRDFVNYSVMDMVFEIGGEYPGIVADHTETRARGPAELAGGLTRRSNSTGIGGKFAETIRRHDPDSPGTGDDTALLIGVDRPQLLRIRHQ